MAGLITIVKAPEREFFIFLLFDTAHGGVTRARRRI